MRTTRMGKIVVSLGFCRVIGATCRFQPRFSLYARTYRYTKTELRDRKKNNDIFFENTAPVGRRRYFVRFGNLHLNRISVRILKLWATQSYWIVDV